MTKEYIDKLIRLTREIDQEVSPYLTDLKTISRFKYFIGYIEALNYEADYKIRICKGVGQGV